MKSFGGAEAICVYAIRTNARPPLTVPDHAELKSGLLRALIRDAGMSIEEFVNALR